MRGVWGVRKVVRRVRASAGLETMGRGGEDGGVGVPFAASKLVRLVIHSS